MFQSTSEIDALFRIFAYKGTPRFDTLLHIEDYQMVDSNFKVKFPKFQPMLQHPMASRTTVPRDIQAVIDGMTCVNPRERMTCVQALEKIGG